jgi:hypothetical protein
MVSKWKAGPVAGRREAASCADGLRFPALAATVRDAGCEERVGNFENLEAISELRPVTKKSLAAQTVLFDLMPIKPECWR